MRLFFIATVMLGLLTTLFISFQSSAKNDTPNSGIYRAITQTPDWLNTSRPLNESDLKGRVILLDFWTFCCINCIHVIPDLKYLEETFGDKLTVIGVHSAKFKNERETTNISN